MTTEAVSTPSSMVKRAWLVLIVAFVIFGGMAGAAASTALAFHRSAMEPREGVLATPGEVLLRPRNETRFKQVRAGEPVREGDTIKTPGGVPAQVALYDGGSLELAEGTLVTIDEFRASRFVNEEKRLQFSQSEGWTRLTVPPLRDYQTGHYTALVNGMVVESVGMTDRATVLSIVMRALDERQPGAGPPERRETMVAVTDGTASLRAGAEAVTLAAGQAITQTASLRLAPPSTLPLDFVHNGAFMQLAAAGGRTVWPVGWRETSDQGGDGGELWGSTEVVHENIDGRSHPVVIFDRRLNAKDNAVHGIQQRLDLPLASFQRLVLKTTLQVRYHSLSGGGIADSEYPIIVKITYRDRQNRSVAWFRGFYTHNEQKLPVPNGVRVGQDEWFTFEQDLLRLGPKQADSEPVFLETLDIYAAGHDFSGAVASVAIVGE